MKKLITALFVLSIVNTYSQEGTIKITNNNYKHSRAMWSPVEDLIHFTSDMEGEASIYIIDSCGENIKRLTSLDYQDWLASWSPDGKQIAYSSLRADDRYQLFIYDLTTNTERSLTTSEFSDYGPSWSPDGTQITYSSKLRGRNVREIFIIDVDGKNKKRLTHDRKVNGLPVFSTNGDRIFYQSNVNYSTTSRADIYSYHLSTSKIERISNPDTGIGIDPFIYHPNKKLAFFGGNKTPDGFGTYWIDLETRKMTKFDVKAQNAGHPTWSYDGKYVTIIDRKLKEIHIHDIENSKTIKVTNRAIIEGK